MRVYACINKKNLHPVGSWLQCSQSCSVSAMHREVQVLCCQHQFSESALNRLLGMPPSMSSMRASHMAGPSWPAGYSHVTWLATGTMWCLLRGVVLTELLQVNHGGRIGVKLCPSRTISQGCFDQYPLFRWVRDRSIVLKRAISMAP